MGWEHLLLGNLDPADIRAVVPVPRGRRAARSPGSLAPLEQCDRAQELGRQPDDVDTDGLQARYPGVQTVRLAASSLVVTLGELNILPDYLSHPDDVDGAPTSFLLPVLQGMRAQNYRQLYRIMGRRPPGPADWSTLRYPYARAFADIREAGEIDALGRRRQRPPGERYLAVLARNAGHFAPFSWYRWQTFHLAGRQLIVQAGAQSGAERRRSRAQVYAGYADHFLQDSFAGSLVVAAGPGDSPYQAWGDRTMLAGEADAMRAATAAHASRRAIAELLSTGEASVDSREIFASMPRRVEVRGTLLSLPDWHDAELRDLCFRELFGTVSTRACKLLLSLGAPKFGEPACASPVT